MAYIQLVEFTTTETEAVRALSTQYRTETEGIRTVVRSMACADTDTPNRFVVIAEFASAADAQVNSDLPQTQALAAAMAELAEGPISYRNLEVLETF